MLTVARVYMIFSSLWSWIY